MKFRFVVLFFLIISIQSQAQTLMLHGIVRDADGSLIPHCPVLLKNPIGAIIQSQVTDTMGIFKFEELRFGKYSLEVNLLSYQPIFQSIDLDKNIEGLEITLRPTSIKLQEVQVKAKAPLSSQKQDTLEFNANTVKVLKDANAEDLVTKMSSISTDNGQIKAQGEQVKQVLVDGKAFFGSDPTAALRNLPAEVIDKIQVFDQLSEQSRFSGVNDGNTTKTINIVTKSGMRNGQFGKVYMGGAYQDKYQIGGNINYFDGDRRLSFIGMSNNINVQNFSSEDITGLTGNAGGNGGPGGFRGGDGGRGGRGNQFRGPDNGNQDFTIPTAGGIATTHAAGINYSDKWTKKIDVNASYFANIADNKIVEDLRQTYFNTTQDIYTSSAINRTDNDNHRIQARLEFKLDTMNTFILRPRVNIQMKNDDSNANYNTTSFSSFITKSRSINKKTIRAVAYNNSLMWRRRFEKKGRSFSLEVNNAYTPKNSDAKQNFENTRIVPSHITDSLNQITHAINNTSNHAAQLEYTEPITSLSQAVISYRLGLQQEDATNNNYDYTLPNENTAILNPTLSNQYKSEYLTHSIGLGYNFIKEKNINFNLRFNGQLATLNNEYQTPVRDVITRHYQNLLPSFFIHKTFDSQTNLRIGYRSSTQIPSIHQLSNVLNNANLLQLTIGNTNLKQSISHGIFARYQKSNIKNASTFFALIGANLQQDYIANAIYSGGTNQALVQKYQVPQGSFITSYINLEDSYSARAFVSYGRPISLIKTNLNTDIAYYFSQVPGIVDSISQLSYNHVITAGITLASNISDKIDYNISYRPSLNLSSFNVASKLSNDFANQNIKLKLNVIILEGFVLRTDYSLSSFDYFDSPGDQNLHLWNIGIGKKIFKNGRGEITLAVNDLLNQNKNISRIINETYIQDVVSNSITRFIMLSFTYNLRNFNTGKKATGPAMQIPESERWRRH